MTQRGRMSNLLYVEQLSRRRLTSFGFKVGNAVHDDMMEEQRLVVDFYVSRQEAVEVPDVPATS